MIQKTSLIYNLIILHFKFKVFLGLFIVYQIPVCFLLKLSSSRFYDKPDKNNSTLFFLSSQFIFLKQTF